MYGGTSQWTTAGTSIFYKTYNVGIDTSTPEQSLDVICMFIIHYQIQKSISFTPKPTTLSEYFTNNIPLLPYANTTKYVFPYYLANGTDGVGTGTIRQKHQEMVQQVQLHI